MDRIQFAVPQTGDNAMPVVEIIQKRAGNTGDFLHLTSNGGTTGDRFNITNAGNCLMSTTTDIASSRLRVSADKSVVAAAGAIWNAIDFMASTLTWTGATTPVTAAAFFNVAGPTVTAASAVVTTDFTTARIGVASFAGVGPASATNLWSLWLDGSCRVDGRMEEKRGVNVAAATDMTLGEDGNSFGITVGTGVLDRIAIARWRAGAVVVLHFLAAVTVSSGTAASATHAGLRLAGSVPLNAVLDGLLVLLYDGTWWQEIGRKVA